MSDFIDRAALIDFMDRVYRAMEADMLAADNAAYLRGYKAALEEIRKAYPMPPIYGAAPEMAEALEAAIDLIDGDLTGLEWKRACRAFVTSARAIVAKARGQA